MKKFLESVADGAIIGGIFDAACGTLAAIFVWSWNNIFPRTGYTVKTLKPFNGR